jgi:ABC-type sugar transport system substrate-binding protein
MRPLGGNSTVRGGAAKGRSTGPWAPRRGRAAPLAAAVALIGVALVGCGSTYDGSKDGPQAKAIARTSIAIDYASYYAPIKDLRRLVLARAKAVGAKVTFSDDASGSPAQLASLRRFTGATGGFKVVVVAPFDAAAVDPIAAKATASGVSVVSYLTPLAHQTTGITVDSGAKALTTDAARWAKRSGSRGQVLLITPPAQQTVPDPFLAYATQNAYDLKSAIRPDSTLTGNLQVAATAQAIGEADAAQLVLAERKAHPGIDLVLTWSDATALGASQALPRSGYVGALGAPAVSDPRTLRMIASGRGPLRTVVAPRLADLASALVDAPFALLRGDPKKATTVPVQTFTKGAAATRAALADYAG